jgi:hypothetical protein
MERNDVSALLAFVDQPATPLSAPRLRYGGLECADLHFAARHRA